MRRVQVDDKIFVGGHGVQADAVVQQRAADGGNVGGEKVFDAGLFGRVQLSVDLKWVVNESVGSWPAMFGDFEAVVVNLGNAVRTLRRVEQVDWTATIGAE